MSQLMRREPGCLTRSELIRLLMKLVLIPEYYQGY